MKKIVLLSVCFVGLASFAQNIPADSLDYYRKSAHGLFIENRMEEAIGLYKNLALSGDALSGYQLHVIYSQGQGVPKDPQEAKKWRSLAESIIAQQAQSKYAERLLTFQGVLNESGRLIELGGREKNTAILVGAAGGAVGGALVAVGMTQKAQAATVIGGIVAGGCGLAALILDIVGNKHIKQGGELMRRVKITGGGISVSF